MDDRNEPYGPRRPVANRWQWTGAHGASWRMPVPPGPPHEPTKVEREQKARAEARVARLHLVGLSNVGVIVICLALAVVVVISALVLISQH